MRVTPGSTGTLKTGGCWIPIRFAEFLSRAADGSYPRISEVPDNCGVQPVLGLSQRPADLLLLARGSVSRGWIDTRDDGSQQCTGYANDTRGNAKVTLGDCRIR